MRCSRHFSRAKMLEKVRVNGVEGQNCTDAWDHRFQIFSAIYKERHWAVAIRVVNGPGAPVVAGSLSALPHGGVVSS